MLRGLLIKESLAEPRVIESLYITKTETWQVQNAAPNQPAVWTALSFEVDASQADLIAQRLSRSLRLQGWYINAATTDTVYVIFPDKVFQYCKGDVVQRSAAREHGQSFGIPESQLDWAE